MKRFDKFYLLVLLGLIMLVVYLVVVIIKPDFLSKDKEKPVETIESYEVSEEYLEDPFSYESDLEGKYIEVHGTVTDTDNSLDFSLTGALTSVGFKAELSQVTINDNIVCYLSDNDYSISFVDGATVVVRGTVKSEGSVLELEDCELKVLHEGNLDTVKPDETVETESGE